MTTAEVATGTSWHSYPSILALGHAGLARLFDGPVVIQEKVDGSQISFGKFNGELKVRSKGAQLNLVAPEGMFVKGVAVIQELYESGKLVEGWTYRGEYLAKPKHNALAYDRIPNNHIILFDINTGHEEYMLPYTMAAYAEDLGLESVPLIHHGGVEGLDEFRNYLDRVSILGGQKIEGVVVKNYAQFGADKKALMGKFVSEHFKEVHNREWKESNPNGGDIVQRLVAMYRTPARWDKAAQHLEERGELEHSPRDIGKLIAEVQADVEKECRDEIANSFYQWGWPQVRRALTAGLPEHYKERLLSRQFSE